MKLSLPIKITKTVCSILMVAVLSFCMPMKSEAVTTGAAIQTETQFISLDSLLSQAVSGYSAKGTVFVKQDADTWKFNKGILINWKMPIVSANQQQGIWSKTGYNGFIGEVLIQDAKGLHWIGIYQKTDVFGQVTFNMTAKKESLKSLPMTYSLILVSKDSNIDEALKFPVVSIQKLGLLGGGSVTVHTAISTDLQQLFGAAKKTKKFSLYCTSGYRSVTKQKAILNQEVSRLTNRGFKDPLTEARKKINLPRQSEHHTGYAVDILSNRAMTLGSFYNTEEAKWLAANAPTYGFVVRYPKGKTHLTGIEYEPWHLRHVGKTFAPIMTKEKLTLEEWVAQGKKGRLYKDSKGKIHYFVVVPSKLSAEVNLDSFDKKRVTHYYINPSWIGFDVEL